MNTCRQYPSIGAGYGFGNMSGINVNFFIFSFAGGIDIALSPHLALVCKMGGGYANMNVNMDVGGQKVGGSSGDFVFNFSPGLAIKF